MFHVLVAFVQSGINPAEVPTTIMDVIIQAKNWLVVVLPSLAALSSVLLTLGFLLHKS